MEENRSKNNTSAFRSNCPTKVERNFCVGEVAEIEEWRIFNGQETTITSNPWLVSIRRNNNHICGGFIVDHNFVITVSCEPLKKLPLRRTENNKLVSRTDYQSLV